MGFQTEFNSVVRLGSEQELHDLFEYGRAAMLKNGFRVYPTGQLLIGYSPENVAVGIIKITASIAEINFQGEEVTKVEMELVRKLTDEESRVLSALARELYFGAAGGAESSGGSAR